MASKNVETFRSAHQAFNRRDFDGVVAQMAENAAYTDHARGTTFQGRAGFKEFMQQWTTAFSNAQVTSPRYIDGGDTVVAEFVGQGTHDGPLGPLPATGKALNLPFCEIMRFDAQGTIVSGGVYYDAMTLMAQLGQAATAGV